MNSVECNRTLDVIRDENDISVELICSSILAFARDLPYSIDFMQEEFVPGVLFNSIPNDCDNFRTFRESGEKTLFALMKDWRDSRKAAYSIQLCLILQNMLLYDKEINIEDSDNLVWGLSIEDSNKLKCTLSKLNDIFKLIKNSVNIEERRRNLELVYETIKQNFSNCSPYHDLKMFYFFNNLPTDGKFVWEKETNNDTIGIKIKMINKNN